MTTRWRRTALAGMLLLGLALPTHAQGDTSTVRFDEVGFEFDHSLGRSVNIARVPGQRLSTGPSLGGEAAPAHLTFSLYQRLAESRRPPRAFGAPGTVRVYAVSALEGYPKASRELARLQALLDERPDPATLEEIDRRQVVDMPILPVDDAAAQIIAARVAYIDTPELTGIAYLTGFAQDLIPVTRDDLQYTFQGLSTDGRWYVAVNWRIRARVLPRSFTNAQARRIGRNARTWGRYIRDTVATLDDASVASFRPNLDALDALVRSIDFESVVPPSTPPSATPSPSVAPSPDGVPASEGPTPSGIASPAPSVPASSAAP